jgi:hypothetical protein
MTVRLFTVHCPSGGVHTPCSPMYMMRRVIESDECVNVTVGWACTLPSRSASLVLVIALIAVGVAFEVGKDLLEEHVSKGSRPVIHAFFGELMVGGFISIVSFLLVNYGAFTGLSKQYFEEPT